MSDKKKYFNFNYKFLFLTLSIFVLFFVFFHIGTLISPQFISLESQNNEFDSPYDIPQNSPSTPFLTTEELTDNFSDFTQNTTLENETELTSVHTASTEDKKLILELYHALILDIPCADIIEKIKEKSISVSGLIDIEPLCRSASPMHAIKHEFSLASKEIKAAVYLNKESPIPLSLRKFFYRLIKIKTPPSKEKDQNLNLLHQAEIQLQENHLQNTFETIQNLSSVYQDKIGLVKEKIESYLRYIQELTSYLCA